MSLELINFIEKYKLDLDDFYDANGRSVSLCYNEMKSNDKLFAFNTTPCEKLGHTIRDRHSHCLACNTAYIAFSLRKKQVGMPLKSMMP